eukprot:746572_1
MNHSIIKWLNESVSSTSFSQQLNTSLTRIYEAHINDSSDDIWNEIRVQYRPILGHGGRTWLCSCYFPQMLSWIYYLEQLNIFHSFKIIQMEQIYLSDEHFQMTMNYLRCYMHSTEHDYEQGMNECMNTTQIHFTPLHKG